MNRVVEVAQRYPRRTLGVIAAVASFTVGGVFLSESHGSRHSLYPAGRTAASPVPPDLNFEQSRNELFNYLKSAERSALIKSKFHLFAERTMQACSAYPTNCEIRDAADPSSDKTRSLVVGIPRGDRKIYALVEGEPVGKTSIKNPTYFSISWTPDVSLPPDSAVGVIIDTISSQGTDIDLSLSTRGPAGDTKHMYRDYSLNNTEGISGMLYNLQDDGSYVNNSVEPLPLDQTVGQARKIDDQVLAAAENLLEQAGI